MEREIPLRITLVQPPQGVTFALQKGKAELVSPARSKGEDLAFDFTLRVKEHPAGRPNFLGPFAQGTPEVRFVYVNSGTCAGEAGSPWTRRVKVQLGGIGWPLVEAVLADPAAVLAARIAGTAKDGGPACATVPLLDGGWRTARAGGPTVALESVAGARIETAARATDPGLEAVVAGLRALVREVVPGMTETINAWGMPNFELDGPFGYHSVAKSHITFGLHRGTSLADPHGLLKGTGKNMRHVKLRSLQDLDRPGLRELVEAAARLNRESPVAGGMGRKRK